MKTRRAKKSVVVKEEKEGRRQGGGVLGMFWDVVRPYGQNEMASKIVTTNDTPLVMPAFPASLLWYCLFSLKVCHKVC